MDPAVGDLPLRAEQRSRYVRCPALFPRSPWASARSCSCAALPSVGTWGGTVPTCDLLVPRRETAFSGLAMGSLDLPRSLCVSGESDLHPGACRGGQSRHPPRFLWRRHEG